MEDTARAVAVFAYGGPRIIENPIFLNGAWNVNMIGTNSLTLTGAIEGNAAKSLLLGTMHGKTTVMGAGERPSPMVLPAPEFLVSERTTLATWMKPPRVE